MKKPECCSMMSNNLDAVCELHQLRKDCPDALISFHPVANEYRLIIHDGGNSGITIDYCPWCGTKL